MERITIDITGMGNAAFADDGNDGRTEAARILRELATWFEALGDAPEFCMDFNGNRVGTVTVE
jgi:hypothetical protein